MLGVGFAVVGTLVAAVACVVVPGAITAPGVVDGARMLGVEVAAVATLTAGVDRVDPGVSSALGVGDAGRILEFEVMVLGSLAAGADCVAPAAGPTPGAGDDRRTLEFEVTVLGTVFVRSDCVDGTSKIVFSIPYAERKITISETQLIMLPLSLRLGFRCMPSEGPTVFCGNARSGVFS